MTIFVAIPSYRDPELVPTLRDCFDKARWPHDLRVGLCWQHDAADSLGGFADDRRIRVVDVPYSESRGACWARSQCAARYEGEDFILQLDSHHRFIKDWDATLIDMMGLVPSRKPILTTYPPAYSPDGYFSEQPTKVGFDAFTAQGPISTIAIPMTNFTDVDAPIPSRFFAGGFSFSIGRFLEDVPPDPQLYFRGEENSVCVRAFTQGYDLFHPHRIVCWHEYGRWGKPKHWEDHVVEHTTAKLWHELEISGLARFRRLFGIDLLDPSEKFGVYGFGTSRTLRDYERYAGVHFGLQGVEEYTLDHGSPPGPIRGIDDEDWMQSLSRTFRIDIDVDGYQIGEALRGSASWILSLCRDNAVIHAHEFPAANMADLQGRRHSTLHIQYLSRDPANGWKMSAPGAGGREFVGSSERIIAVNTASEL
jgi:Glycosyltransferase (GlcNAc)